MDEQTAQILLAISEMTSTVGWQHLKKDFTFQIEKLQEEINEVGGNDVKYSENDILKTRLKILKDIIAYPAQFISIVQTQQTPEELDPYR